MTRAATFSAALILAIVAQGSAARADELRRLRYGHDRSGRVYFVRTTVDDDPTVALRWEDTVIRLTPGDGTTDLGDAAQLAIVQSVVDTWNAAGDSCGSSLELQLAPRAQVEVGNDGINQILFRENSWCAPIDCDRWCGERADCPGGEECHDPGSVAITTLCYNVSTGTIVDADIEFNAVDFAMSAEGSSLGEGPLADLANTLTHEVGHLIGLGHACWADTARPQPVDDEGNPVPRCTDVDQLTPEITEATMFAFQEPGETKKATLEQDDIDAVCAIYPLDPDVGGGCAVGGRRTPSPGSLLVVGIVALALGRRRRTQPLRIR